VGEVHPPLHQPNGVLVNEPVEAYSRRMKWALVIAVALLGAWVFRYETQVLPILQPEDGATAKPDASLFIAEDGLTYSVNPQTGLAGAITNQAGEPLKLFVRKVPLVVYQWDRWTQTGTLKVVGGIDSRGAVTLEALKR
jgi:hypothetical protein